MLMLLLQAIAKTIYLTQMYIEFLNHVVSHYLLSLL